MQRQRTQDYTEARGVAIWQELGVWWEAVFRHAWILSEKSERASFRKKCVCVGQGALGQMVPGEQSMMKNSGGHREHVSLGKTVW